MMQPANVESPRPPPEGDRSLSVPVTLIVVALAGSIFHALSPLIERNHQWHSTSRNGINCPRLSVSAATSNASATKSGEKNSPSSSPRTEFFLHPRDAVRWIRMATQESDRASTRMPLDGLQERDHPARVIARPPQHPHSERIGLLLSRPAVFKQHRVQSETAYRAHHLTGSAIHASSERHPDQSQSSLRQISLRRLIGSMAQRDVRDLVSHHSRDLIVGPRGLQGPAIDVDEAAGQGEGVDRIVVHDSELVRIACAGSIRRQPLSDSRHARVLICPQLPVDHRRRLSPDLVILPRRKDVEPRFVILRESRCRHGHQRQHESRDSHLYLLRSVFYQRIHLYFLLV